MDTQRNKFTNGTQKKGGKDVTRMVLTASGGVAVGAAGATGAAILHQEDEPIVPEKEEEQTTTPEQEEAAQDQPAQQTDTPEQTTNTPNEIHPVDNNNTSSSTTTTTTDHNTTYPTGSGNNNAQPAENTTFNDSNNTSDTNPTIDDIDSTIDDVDPTLIAEEITATEIDPNDNDMADMINVDMVDTLYLEDGTEMPTALFHTPDGGEFMMVDIDNDLTFDVITDLEGNPVLAVESNLTMSDIEDMIDDSGNMLAYNEEQNNQELAHGGNPEDDIIITDLSDGDPWDDEDLAFSGEQEDDDDYEEEDIDMSSIDDEPAEGFDIDNV